MSAISNYLENSLLDLVFNGVPFVPPVNVYVALFTSPTDDAAGGTEVSGGGYARQAITFNPAANGQVSSDADVIFPIAAAAWGTVTHAAYYDALVAGNKLMHGPLVSPRTIGIGDTFKFNEGEAIATLD